MNNFTHVTRLALALLVAWSCAFSADASTKIRLQKAANTTEVSIVGDKYLIVKAITGDTTDEITEIKALKPEIGDGLINYFVYFVVENLASSLESAENGEMVLSLDDNVGACLLTLGKSTNYSNYYTFYHENADGTKAYLSSSGPTYYDPQILASEEAGTEFKIQSLPQAGTDNSLIGLSGYMSHSNSDVSNNVLQYYHFLNETHDEEGFINNNYVRSDVRVAFEANINVYRVVETLDDEDPAEPDTPEESGYIYLTLPTETATYSAAATAMTLRIAAGTDAALRLGAAESGTPVASMSVVYADENDDPVTVALAADGDGYYSLADVPAGAQGAVSYALATQTGLAELEQARARVSVIGNQLQVESDDASALLRVHALDGRLTQTATARPGQPQTLTLAPGCYVATLTSPVLQSPISIKVLIP